MVIISLLHIFLNHFLSYTSNDAFLPLDQVGEMLRRPQDISKVLYYKDLSHEELWLESASRLTAVVQQIIEFAKMVPGFMKLPQDDQIVLLKAGAFELVVLRVSRHFDPATNSVLFGETLLPPDAFRTSDTTEMKLVLSLFDVARAVAELKLSDTQLALYSAYVLLSPGTPFLQFFFEKEVIFIIFCLIFSYRSTWTQGNG